MSIPLKFRLNFIFCEGPRGVCLIYGIWTNASRSD